MSKVAQALSIAGSDSGGGAGIQADLKTFQERGVFGTTAITAITAQNTTGVFDIHQIPLETIQSQLKAIADDFDIKAFKVGMLGSQEVITCVANCIKKYDFGYFVLDPVMISKGGVALLQENATKALKEDPVLNKVNSKPVPIGDVLMAGIAMSTQVIAKLIDQAKTVVDQDSKGEYIKVTVKLPEAAKTGRVAQFIPAVKKYSREFKVDPALVLAVMHTESHFNPLAQSHIPAFGLMQIVPNSAGKDVQRLIHKRNQAPSSSMLFNPDINIQHGCAYLHILNYRYLKAIKNK